MSPRTWRYCRQKTALGFAAVFLLNIVAPSAPAFATQTSADSLSAYWKFDETSGTSAVDSSGELNTGTNSGSTISTDVPTTTYTNARSLLFDGVRDTVTIPSSSSLNIGANNFTTMAWVKGNDMSASDIIFGKSNGGGASTSYGFLFGIFSGSYPAAIWATSASALSIVQSDVAISNGAWTHVAVVVDRSNSANCKVYINGSAVNTTVTALATNTGDITNSVDLRFGSESDGSFNWDGYIDDARIYKRAMSNREIAEIAAGNHPTTYWKGKAGPGFENQKNWSGSYIPDPYSKIVIRAATGSLTLTGAIKMTGLTINTGALMNIAGTGITMLDSGTFTNYGTFALKNSETLTNITVSTDKGTVMVVGSGATTGFKTGNTYNNLTINDGLLAYWNFENATGVRASDASGYGNSGSMVGGGSFVASPAPTNFYNTTSLSLNGTDSYFSGTDFRSGDNVSLAFWVNPATASNAQSFVGKHMRDGDNILLTGIFSDGYHARIRSATYQSGSVTTGWQHLTYTFQRTGTSTTLVNVYKNGARLWSRSLSAIIGDTAGLPWVFGQDWDAGPETSDFFGGTVDEVRIYGRVLNNGEISALAAGNQPSAAKGAVTLNGALNLNGSLTLNAGRLDVSTSNYGIVVGGSWINNGGVFVPRSSTVTFTGTTSGMEILSGGQQFAKLTFNGTGGTWNVKDRLTSSGTAVLTAGTVDPIGSHTMRFGQFVQNGGAITPRSGTVAITSPLSQTNKFTNALNVLRIEDPTENGLVGYWKFNEGTNTGSIVDSSGYAQTAIRRGSGSVWTSSVPSLTFDNPSAMSFNGYGDWVTSTVSSSFPDGSTSFTQALWIRTTGTGSLKTLLTRRNQGSWNQSDWPTMFLTQGSITLAVDDNSYMNTSDFIPVNDGEWHHVVGVKDGYDYSLYVDGTLRDSFNDTHPMNGSSGLPLAIGRAPSWAGSFFSGDLDDVRVYNRVLSAHEIVNLARGRYAAGNSSTATVTLGGDLSTAYLALDSGNLSASGYALTVTNSLSMLRGRGNLTLGSAVTTLGGLIMSGAKITSGAGTLDINGSVALQTGSLIAPSGYLTLSGNWNKTGGYFTTSSGTVQLDGTDQTLSGSSTFYNLTKSVTTAATLTFEAAKTFVVNGMLTLNGAASNLLSLRSSTTGVPWIIYPRSTTGVQYLDVQDSTNTGSTVIDCMDLDCIDSGNNVNWTIGVTPPSSSSQSSGYSQGPGGGRGKGTSLINALRARTALLQDYDRTIVREPDEEKEKEEVIAEKEKPQWDGTYAIERQRNRVVLAAGESRIIYKDVVADAWYAPYVASVIESDIARGYKDESGQLTGEFGVGKSVTKAEILKMALEASGKNELKAAAPRNKTAQGSWASSYVGIAESLSLSIFTPNTDVNSIATRGQVVQLIMETMSITIGKTPANYSDVPNSHPHSNAIAAATFFGLIAGDTKSDGTPLNTFRPDAPINRAEASKLIAMARTLQKMGFIAPAAVGGVKPLSSVANASSAAASSVATSAPVVPELTKAKVITQQLKVRLDSRSNADWVGTIYHGHIVTILWPLDNGWSYIKTSHGKEGYVESEFLEPIQ